MMDEKEFESKYAKVLDDFDDLFETSENYTRISDDVLRNIPDAPLSEKEFRFEHLYQTERTNNLIRLALKNFLLSDSKD